MVVGLAGAKPLGLAKVLRVSPLSIILTLMLSNILRFYYVDMHLSQVFK